MGLVFCSELKTTRISHAQCLWRLPHANKQSFAYAALLLCVPQFPLYLKVLQASAEHVTWNLPRDGERGRQRGGSMNVTVSLTYQKLKTTSENAVNYNSTGMVEQCWPQHCHFTITFQITV